MLKTPRRRRLLAVLALLVLLGGAYALYDALRAKVYFISVLSFNQFEDKGIPDDVLLKLNDIRGKRFFSREALEQDMEQRVGRRSYANYRGKLTDSIRTRYCFPNSGGQVPHLPRTSKAHPLYNRFTFEPVLPQDAVPPLMTVFNFLPEGEGLLLLGKKGTLIWLDAAQAPHWRLDLPDVYQGDGDQGALGMTLDPAFADNRFVYVGSVTADEQHTAIWRVTLSEDPQAVLESRVEIFRADKDDAHPYHGIGALNFRSDGVLLVPLGDPTTHSQQLWDLQGKLLGIRPGLGPEGGHSGPGLGLWHSLRSTVLYGDSAVLAKGLRSPWTATLWGDTLIIGDVGGNGAFSTEEVNWYRGAFTNWGWGACEDPALHGDYTPPMIAYFRNDPEPGRDSGASREVSSRSVLVGPVYDNPAQDRYGGALDGRLIYEDFYLGFVRGAKLSPEGVVEDDVTLAIRGYLTHLRVGPDGYIYAASLIGKDGLVRLVPKAAE